MADKKLFPLEKILTISAEEYCESNDNTFLHIYNMIGVHAYGNSLEHVQEIISTQVPKAEVIVAYKAFPDINGAILASGTALIPKER
jgi:hypothetical protein